MEETTILSWNVTNWVTVVLMVAVAWWLYVGVRGLIVKRTQNG
jgi:hypothetical protein